MSTSEPLRQTEGYANDSVLVDAGWLEAHLRDPGLRVVEVDVSPLAYDEWHLEGAVLWNIYSDLKDPDYHLVDEVAIGQLLSRSGITPETTVVFYGYGPAMGFWLMKLLRHADVRILNCSRDAWRAGGRACVAGVDSPSAAHYPLPDLDQNVRAVFTSVEQAIGDPHQLIADVRSQPEFRGERFWPSGAPDDRGRAGHVPSAVHVPLDGLYDDDGAFRPADELRRLFSAVDLSSGEPVITYCAIGGRASTAWFALTYLLGRQQVRVYDGSWAEWGHLPSAPVDSAQLQHRPGVSGPSAQESEEFDMAGLIRMSFDTPEETRPFEGGSGQLELVNRENGAVGRATFLPGWRWSEHVAPIAKTASCQAAHTCYFVSGRMKVVMDDGEEEFGPGDFAIIPPGHDAWIVGDEPCVVIDWQGFADYARR